MSALCRGCWAVQGHKLQDCAERAGCGAAVHVQGADHRLHEGHTGAGTAQEAGGAAVSSQSSCLACRSKGWQPLRSGTTAGCRGLCRTAPGARFCWQVKRLKTGWVKSASLGEVGQQRASEFLLGSNQCAIQRAFPLCTVFFLGLAVCFVTMMNCHEWCTA